MAFPKRKVIIDRPGGVYTAGRNYFHRRNGRNEAEDAIYLPSVGRGMSLALSRTWLLRVSRGGPGHAKGSWLRPERGASAVVGVRRGLTTTSKVTTEPWRQ